MTSVLFLISCPLPSAPSTSSPLLHPLISPFRHQKAGIDKRKPSQRLQKSNYLSKEKSSSSSCQKENNLKLCFDLDKLHFSFENFPLTLIFSRTFLTKDKVNKNDFFERRKSTVIYFDIIFLK